MHSIKPGKPEEFYSSAISIVSLPEEEMQVAGFFVD